MTGSIVLYNNEREIILKAINSFLSSLKVNKLFLIDNSPRNELENIIIDERVEYIHNPSNPGFGASHNIAFNRAIEMNSKYHFVINPDIYFVGDVVSQMINFMDENVEVGMLMPEILNDDNSVQNLPKLLPSPFSVLLRKLKRPKFIYDDFINQYELRFVDKKIIYNAPILSGCFTLFRINSVKDVGVYDDKFFMYFEDWDLSRRMHLKYKTIYFPKVSVFHGYESGANKSSRLLKIFIKSAIHYFNKWGWFFDRERKMINKKTLHQFK